jgi:hypothetical protein
MFGQLSRIECLVKLQFRWLTCPFLETNAHGWWVHSLDFLQALPIWLVHPHYSKHIFVNSTLPTPLITTSTAGFHFSIIRFTDNKWRRQFSSTLLRVSLRVRALLLSKRLDCSVVSKMSLKSLSFNFSDHAFRCENVDADVVISNIRISIIRLLLLNIHIRSGRL